MGARMKLHSISDIVTNSSTEIFVIPADKKVTAEEFLADMEPIWEAWKKRKLESSETWGSYYGVCEDTKFRDIIDIFVANKDVKETYTGYKNREETFYQYNSGDLVVRGSEDNIIPYALFSLIDDMFDAEHYHLG
jgi:hypothetical protein